MSFLDRVAACAPADLAAYLPFRVDGQGVGWVTPAFAESLRRFGDVFRVDADVSLAPGLDDPDARTGAVDGVLRRLAEDGLVPGWRDEPYPVATTYSAPTLMTLERAAVPLFGIRGYGVHLNGIVRDPSGVSMWIGRRAIDKPTAPGKLDQVVAGGQPAGISPSDNLVKESAEEADMSPDLVAAARAVGAISYCTARPEGLRNDVLFVYDLELPGDFRPRNTDGEIDDFYLWPLDRVTETVRDSDEFKFNCALVVIDFLIRHGHIGPEEPDYMALIDGLHG
jgi:hypothetical protein